MSQLEKNQPLECVTEAVDSYDFSNTQKTLEVGFIRAGLNQDDATKVSQEWTNSNQYESSVYDLSKMSIDKRMGIIGKFINKIGKPNIDKNILKEELLKVIETIEGSREAIIGCHQDVEHTVLEDYPQRVSDYLRNLGYEDSRIEKVLQSLYKTMNGVRITAKRSRFSKNNVYTIDSRKVGTYVCRELKIANILSHGVSKENSQKATIFMQGLLISLVEALKQSYIKIYENKA